MRQAERKRSKWKQRQSNISDGRGGENVEGLRECR